MVVSVKRCRQEQYGWLHMKWKKLERVGRQLMGTIRPTEAE